MVTRATVTAIAFFCLTAQAFAQLHALYGYWPVGGGNITVASTGAPVAVGGIEFIAEPGILAEGTRPDPLTFFIPNTGTRTGIVTLGSLGTAITIDGPVEFDVAVSATAVRGDISGGWGGGTRPLTEPPSPGGIFSLGPCGVGDDCLAPVVTTIVACDLNGDGRCDSIDIDFLSSAIQSGDDAVLFDLNEDGVVAADDRVFWIESINGTLTGDADLNGFVQFADFLALSNSFGEEGGWAQGDFDGDGLVEFADFLVLSTNFGFSSSDIVTVPEPSSSFAALFGLLVCTAFRRQR